MRFLNKAAATGLLLLLAAFQTPAEAQQSYRYRVDLNQVTEDRLNVELLTPAIRQATITFRLPAIIPGTYRMSDYGRFVHNLKAFDKAGKALPVQSADANSWTIREASRLYRITYQVEDTWDSPQGKEVFSMAGTNIEEGKNFVINPFGFFGYFEAYRNLPFELTFLKPAHFYGSTALKPINREAGKDVFQVADVDALYDAPIMYNQPDTTTIHIGHTEVLISVYAPQKKVQSAFLAQHFTKLLQATSHYLGGRLPVDRYAFILYFNSEQAPFTTPGALEHNTSSFYSLPEIPQQQFIGPLTDIAAHEFFHIVTPLNVASQEVKQFNYSKPVLSRHLWLYEGSTEYASDHVQVKYGMNTVQQFLDKLGGKIGISSQYADTLSFTRLSQESAGRYKDQYFNVYEKGALIAAALDIYLLHLSGGGYDLQKLKHDLSVRFGKERFFPDEALFDIITELSYGEVRDFFRRYVEGGAPLPYADFFALAGVQYLPEKKVEELTMGNFSPAPTADGKVVVVDVSKLNAFGKAMGYQLQDELLSVNGTRITPANLGEVISRTRASLKEGQELVVVVARKNGAGAIDTVRLAAPAQKTVNIRHHVLELMPQPTPQQVQVRNAWLSLPHRPLSPMAQAADVATIDGITRTLYSVISGPPGKRDWERFRSIFYPGAQMAASHQLPNGQSVFSSFSTEDYIKSSGAYFEQHGFYEEELGRQVEQYGNVALVRSAYQYKLQKDGPVDKRGINGISLVRDKGRWWVTHILWQEETPDHPLPKEFEK